MVRTILDCFNTKHTRKDGLGLFSGAGRYEMLTRKLPDAVQKGVEKTTGRYRFDLFYSKLLQTMLWPNPPLSTEKVLWQRLVDVPLKEEEAMLDYIRANAEAVVGLAAVGHTELREETETEIDRIAKDHGERPEDEWQAVLTSVEEENEA